MIDFCHFNSPLFWWRDCQPRIKWKILKVDFVWFVYASFGGITYTPKTG